MKTPHYICTGGCGGAAEERKNCGAESCNNYNKPLEECDCTDGRHIPE